MNLILKAFGADEFQLLSLLILYFIAVCFRGNFSLVMIYFLEMGIRQGIFLILFQNIVIDRTVFQLSRLE